MAYEYMDMDLLPKPKPRSAPQKTRSRKQEGLLALGDLLVKSFTTYMDYQDRQEDKEFRDWQREQAKQEAEWRQSERQKGLEQQRIDQDYISQMFKHYTPRDYQMVGPEPIQQPPVIRSQQQPLYEPSLESFTPDLLQPTQQPTQQMTPGGPTVSRTPADWESFTPDFSKGTPSIGLMMNQIGQERARRSQIASQDLFDKRRDEKREYAAGQLKEKRGYEAGRYETELTDIRETNRLKAAAKLKEVKEKKKIDLKIAEIKKDKKLPEADKRHLSALGQLKKQENKIRVDLAKEGKGEVGEQPIVKEGKWWWSDDEIIGEVQPDPIQPEYQQILDKNKAEQEMHINALIEGGNFTPDYFGLKPESALSLEEETRIKKIGEIENIQFEESELIDKAIKKLAPLKIRKNWSREQFKEQIEIEVEKMKTEGSQEINNDDEPIPILRRPPTQEEIKIADKLKKFKIDPKEEELTGNSDQSFDPKELAGRLRLDRERSGLTQPELERIARKIRGY